MTSSTLRATLVGAAATALVVAGFHALPAAASSTTGESASIASPIERRDADTDGKSLFRAVHFYQGDAVKSLIKVGALVAAPEAVQSNATPEAVDAVDAVIDAIQADDPTFFASFAADLRSGDPYQVDSALQRSSEHISTHGELIADDGDSSGLCLATAIVVVGFGWVVYAASVAVVLDKYVAVTRPREALSAEQFVAKLTPVLATS